jgi:plasmid maintenance system antidote protein VapI
MATFNDVARPDSIAFDTSRDLFDPKLYGRIFQQELGKRGLSYRQAESQLHISYRKLHRIATGHSPVSVEEYLRINRWMEA